MSHPTIHAMSALPTACRAANHDERLQDRMASYAEAETPAIDDGGPAFVIALFAEGISIRSYFSAKAIIEIFSLSDIPDAVCRLSDATTDAMIARRKS